MKPKKTRRQFVKAAALAVAGPVLAETSAPAQAPAKTPRAIAAQGLTDIVRSRHGKHLTEAQLQDIQQAITRSLAGAEFLKRTPLENGDEPTASFSAEVEE
jgi:hypothetical protein